MNLITGIEKFHKKKDLTFVRPFQFAREERLELPTPGFGDQFDKIITHSICDSYIDIKNHL